MDEKLKELIAIGASVTAHCQPCLTYHVERARTAGAAPDEIADAVAVGRTVRAGAGAKFDRLAASLAEREPEPAAVEQDGGCGCG